MVGWPHLQMGVPSSKTTEVWRMLLGLGASSVRALGVSRTDRKKKQQKERWGSSDFGRFWQRCAFEQSFQWSLSILASWCSCACKPLNFAYFKALFSTCLAEGVFDMAQGHVPTKSPHLLLTLYTPTGQARILVLQHPTKSNTLLSTTIIVGNSKRWVDMCIWLVGQWASSIRTTTCFFSWKRIFPKLQCKPTPPVFLEGILKRTFVFAGKEKQDGMPFCTFFTFWCGVVGPDQTFTSVGNDFDPALL